MHHNLLKNISIEQFQTFLKLAKFDFIGLNGGHEKWTRKDILRPIIFQSRIDPIPYAIIDRNLSIIGCNPDIFLRTLNKENRFKKNVLVPALNDVILSNQEIKVVQLICQEKTSQEIADILFVSKKTIESHRDRILTKINACNMVGIALYAVKHNLVKFS